MTIGTSFMFLPDPTRQITRLRFRLGGILVARRLVAGFRGQQLQRHNPFLLWHPPQDLTLPLPRRLTVLFRVIRPSKRGDAARNDP